MSSWLIANVILFVVVSYVTLYVFPNVDLTVSLVFNTLSSPDGSWSTIFDAYPSISPSLYIWIWYVITLPSDITIGSFLCLYVAVVSSPLIVDVSIFMFLAASNPFSFFIAVFPSTSNIVFLKAKSNNESTVNESSIFFEPGVTSTIGCSTFDSVSVIFPIHKVLSVDVYFPLTVTFITPSMFATSVFGTNT